MNYGQQNDEVDTLVVHLVCLSYLLANGTCKLHSIWHVCNLGHTTILIFPVWWSNSKTKNTITNSEIQTWCSHEFAVVFSGFAIRFSFCCCVFSFAVTFLRVWCHNLVCLRFALAGHRSEGESGGICLSVYRCYKAPLTFSHGDCPSLR